MASNAEKAQIALEKGLFVAGWELEGILESITKGAKGEVSLTYRDGKAVGVCAHLTEWTHCPTVVVFVKEQYRRQGIGTELVSKYNTTGNTYAKGDEGSMYFWNNFKQMEYY